MNTSSFSGGWEDNFSTKIGSWIRARCLAQTTPKTDVSRAGEKLRKHKGTTREIGVMPSLQKLANAQENMVHVWRNLCISHRFMTPPGRETDHPEPGETRSSMLNPDKREDSELRPRWGGKDEGRMNEPEV